MGTLGEKQQDEKEAEAMDMMINNLLDLVEKTEPSRIETMHVYGVISKLLTAKYLRTIARNMA